MNTAVVCGSLILFGVVLLGALRAVLDVSQVLLMPEQDYHIDGRVVQFPATTDKPEIGLTVKYYPRVTAGGRAAQ